MNGFVRLFEEYGFNVEPFGHNSYIADNGTFCVPFTVDTTKTAYGEFSTIAAVSFLSCDKEDIKTYYTKRNTRCIGHDVFSDWMNDRLKFMHIGKICNHDHSAGEVENWLKGLNT